MNDEDGDRLAYYESEDQEDDWTEIEKTINQGNQKDIDAKGRSELHYAIEAGNELIVRMLLEKMSTEAISDALNDDGMTALHKAVKRYYERIVHQLLNINPSLVDMVDINGKTALHYAGTKTIAELLLTKMSQKTINAVDNEGNNALHEAAKTNMSGHQRVAQILLQTNPELANVSNKSGMTPLHCAVNACHNNLVIEALLLKMSEKAITTRDGKGKTALDAATIYENNGDIVYLFLQACPKLFKVSTSRIKNDDLFNALKVAIKYGNDQVINLLLTIISTTPSNIDRDFSRYTVEHLDVFEKTVLHRAVEDGDVQIVELLLTKMNQNDIDRQGGYNKETALHVAIEKGYTQIGKLLLTKMSLKGANTTNKEGKTALQEAVKRGYEDIVEILIQNTSQLADKVGSIYKDALPYATNEKIINLLITKIGPKDINIIDSEGNTVLHQAVLNGNELVVALLLQISPQLVEITNNIGRTALHMAPSNSIAKLLFTKMTPKAINTVGKEGDTVLHQAVMKGDAELIEILIQTNPQLLDINPAWVYTVSRNSTVRYNISNINSHGDTVLHQAFKKGHTQTLDLLLTKINPLVLNQVNKQGETVLHLAVKAGNTQIVELLLTKMSQEAINSVTNSGMTALHIAAAKEHGVNQSPYRVKSREEKGKTKDIDKADINAKKNSKDYVQIVDLLLKKMSSEAINAVSKHGTTAIHITAAKGDVQMAELLLAKMHPEAVNAVNKYNETILHIAVQKGHVSLAALLITKMSPEVINTMSNHISEETGLQSGETPLYIAAARGNVEMVDLLLTKIHLEAINLAGSYSYEATRSFVSTSFLVRKSDRAKEPIRVEKTILNIAVEKKHTKVVELLFTRMTSEAINDFNQQGNNILSFATNEQIAHMLLDKMRPEAINSSDKNDKTALHIAAERGYYKLVELLLTRMSSETINAVDKYGKSALSYAANEQIANLLLTKMSLEAINAVGKYGKSALYLAAEKGHIQVVEWLLAKMSQEIINLTVGYDKETVLHIAAKNGYLQIAELLLTRMSLEAVNVVNEYGQTAFHIAVEKGYTELVELLLTKMSQESINSVDKYNKETMLHLAAENGHTQIVELLLTKMSLEEIYIVNKNNKSALHHAINKGHKKVITLIQDKMPFDDVLHFISMQKADFGTNKTKAMQHTIQFVIERCKALLSILPNNITKIVYDYIILSQDTTGNLINETGASYSDYKFKQILEVGLKDELTSILPVTTFNNEEQFLENIQEIQKSIISGTSVVIPIRIQDCLSGLIINKYYDNNFQFLYIDSRGNRYLAEKNITPLKTIVAGLIEEYDTFEVIHQQRDNQNLDAFVVETLIRLVEIGTEYMNIKDFQNVYSISRSPSDVDRLRLEHVELLQDEGILAAMPVCENIELGDNEPELTGIEPELSEVGHQPVYPPNPTHPTILEDITVAGDCQHVQMHFLGEF